MTTCASPFPLVELVGAACALGAPHPGSAAAPQTLRDRALQAQLAAAGLRSRWLAMLHPAPAWPGGRDMAARLHASAGFAARLADCVAAGTGFPVVLGGDHGIAVGTWRGLARRHGAAPGLVWIDAHLDSHTAASTHSGNIHGMPLATLLGHGDAAFAQVRGPLLDARRCCVIGARAWEGEERSLLDALGVRVFDAAEVRARSLATTFAEAVGIARGSGPDHAFGISFDLDALDDAIFPAVTCPEAQGLDAAQLARCLHELPHRHELIGFEVVEYRPDLDVDARGARWIAAFIAAACGAGGDFATLVAKAQ